MKIFILLTLSIFTALLPVTSVKSQPSLIQDYSHVMQIPEVSALVASPTHLYVQSQQDGMAVFRIQPNTVQWLYTSSGMQRRGNRISADVRFAYLAGENKRLTVLEPTSVLGVYSATLLPTKPLATARLQNNLYIALGDLGLGTLSLETPETVDSEVQIVQEIGENIEVIDVISSPLSNQLFVLTSNSKLDIFNVDNGELIFNKSLNITQQLSKLFIDGERVWGASKRGDIYKITANGLGKKVAGINEPVQTIKFWNDFTLIRSASGKVWYIHSANNKLIPWKTDTKAGNFIAKSGDQLWISENNKISKIDTATVAQNLPNKPTGPFSIKNINNRILTYPNSLLLGFEIENGYSANNVEFSVRSTVNNVKVKKQGLYWQPTASQIGMNWFTIIATNSEGETDSTRFTVDVRSFNTPPRFSPNRTSTIAVNEAFSLQIKAIDPENPESSLIRYLGVDLPEGATINEETGVFSWTPSARQTGSFTFRVIATDELGAAASQDVSLTVLDISRGDGN